MKRIADKYNDVFKRMDEHIEHRKAIHKMPAMGYTTNLDILCDFQIDRLNQLIAEHMPGVDLNQLEAANMICNVEDFIRTLVYFCKNGIGGEVEIQEIGLVEKFFSTTNGIGGTAAQAAMALAAVGCPSIIHMTDDSKEVCDILDSELIYTVSPSGSLIPANQVTQQQEQEIHYIMQFQKGDVIRSGDQEITIPESNRLIITKITVNETVPFSKPYFAYIEQHAQQISSNVLSSFNCIFDQAVLQERLNDVRRHISNYKANHPAGIVFFEDAHFHSQQIRRMCVEQLYPEVDIVCMNEEELASLLKMYQIPVHDDGIIGCVEGIQAIRNRFKMKHGVILHTKDYAMYMGEQLAVDLEIGLMYGNMLATAKAMSGWYGTRQQIEEVLKLPLSPVGVSYQQQISNSEYANEVIIVPTKYIEKPKYTIGLGDSFVAGVQLCFV